MEKKWSDIDFNTFLLVLVVFFISLLSTYFVIFWSHKKSLFIDDENSNKPQGYHEKPTPRIGGLSIFLSMLFAVTALPSFLGLFVVLLPSFVSGVLEDLSSKISPRIRLIFMLATSVLAITILDAVVMDFGLFRVHYYIGIFITVVAIIGLTNGVNFIDGYNGLAGITIMTILGTFLAFTLSVNDSAFSTLILLIMVGIIGFLLFNYPSGRIFLGDGGAYFLGALLAVMSILLFNKYPTAASPWFYLVVLIYPVWEVIFSFFRKILIHKTSPMQPDRYHFHMLFFRSVAFNKNSLVVLFIVPILLLNNTLAYIYRNNTYALLLIALGFIGFYSFTYVYLRKKDFALASQKKVLAEFLKQNIGANAAKRSQVTS